jgi:Xaa-Pro dipeptidase
MAADLPFDDKDLREGRRQRVFAEMEERGLDALLLGREANSRYVSGANRLWTAGTRPYGPGCVVVRETGAVHLVSTWDEGIPDDIPHEHLFGITWNPGTLLEWIGGIEGMAAARRIGTDSLTPRFAKLLGKFFPDAELVDAEPALEQARSIKTPEEVEAIRRALAVAEAALAAAVAELRPGVTPRQLAGVFMEAMAQHGVTTPGTQRVAWASSAGAQVSEGSPLGADDLVSFDASVVAGGYMGELGRTWRVDPEGASAKVRELFDRADALFERLLAACGPGAHGADLLAAYRSGGDEPPEFPLASGLGLGFDLPVVDRHLPETAAEERLEAGMALALTASAVGEAGSVFYKEAVLVTPSGPEVLTTSPRWHS